MTYCLKVTYMLFEVQLQLLPLVSHPFGVEIITHHHLNTIQIVISPYTLITVPHSVVVLPKLLRWKKTAPKQGWNIWSSLGRPEFWEPYSSMYLDPQLLCIWCSLGLCKVLFQVIQRHFKKKQNSKKKTNWASENRGV